MQELNASALEETDRLEVNSSLHLMNNWSKISEVRTRRTEMRKARSKARGLKANRLSVELNSITGLRVMAPLQPKCGVSLERCNAYSVRASQLREERKFDLSQIELSQVSLGGENAERQLVKSVQVSSQEHLEKLWSNKLIEKLRHKDVSQGLEGSPQNEVEILAEAPNIAGRDSAETWQELDKYLEEILEHGEEAAAKFLYFNVRKDSANPYDLDLTTFNNRNVPVYFIISAKGVTHYKHDKAFDFIPLNEWLVERDLYSNIKELTFFKHFKRWKLLKTWRQGILSAKRKHILDELSDKLFYTDEHYQRFILKHTKSMHELSKLRLIVFARQGESTTLREFSKAQKKRESAVAAQIAEHSKDCGDEFRKLMKTALGRLRSYVREDVDGREDTERPRGNVAFEALGFPGNLAYGHRAALRRECARFLRLSYLIDFMSMKALGDIYLGTVKETLNTLDMLNTNATMKISVGQELFQKTSEREPILRVSACFDPQPIPEEHITKKQIAEFSDRNSKPKDFNLFCHIEMQGESKESRLLKKYYKQEVPQIVSLWLSLKPGQQELINYLNACIENGLKVLLNFERWSKNKELSKYANALEDWDNVVGGVWEISDSSVLDPTDCIAESEEYKVKDKRLAEIISSAYKKANDFLEVFGKYLHYYWMNEKANFELLFDDQVLKPLDTLTNVLKLLEYQRDKFGLKVPDSCNIGILKVDCARLRKVLLPSPAAALKKIERTGGSLMRGRVKIIKEWATNSRDQLLKKVATVDDYVAQKNAWNEITGRFQRMKDQIDLYGSIYSVLVESALSVKKEDRVFHNETLQEMMKLGQLIANVADQQELQLDSIKRKLNETLIPELNEQLETLKCEVLSEKFLERSQTVGKTIEDLRLVETTFKACESLAEKYRTYQQTLSMEASEFGLVEEIREELGLRSELWKSLQKWGILSDRWSHTQFKSINPKEIGEKAEEFFMISKRIDKELPENPVSTELKSAVKTFQKLVPVVEAFNNRSLDKHHWLAITTLLQRDLDLESPDFTLRALLELGVVGRQEEIARISQQAMQEALLKQQLGTLDELWKRTTFTVRPYKYKDAYVLDEAEVIFNATDESLAIINTILGSRHVKPLLGQAEGWRSALLNLQGIMDEWTACQRRWIYLENIFSGQDVKKQLANEAGKFETVDRFFRKLMQRAFKMSHPLRLIKAVDKNLLETLKHHNKTLDEIEKLLEEYLEGKRKDFPRFYFLSSDELLELMANQQNLEAVQQFLPKCFDSLCRLDIQENLDMTAMYSAEGECVPLPRPTRAKENAEVWLDALQTNMKDTLMRAMKVGLADYDVVDREDWVLKHSGQVVATVAQISWTATTEATILEIPEYPGALMEWYEENVEQIQQLAELVRSRSDRIKRRIITGLIAADVHARDTLEALVLSNTTQLRDFNWQRQLRYYWDEEDSFLAKGCYIRQMGARVDYGYEYIGPGSRLVVTPLTERCWVGITGALSAYMGAALVGPAGTGKTESIKDLAKGLGIYCVTFNCSEGVTSKLTARLFSGAAQQGAWLCLDNFHRTPAEVSSVVARQIAEIRAALKKGEQTFMFEEKETALKNCGVFVTVGPECVRELPGNLRTQFRPVAVMAPDCEIVAEVTLFAEGFGKAKTLSKKIVKFYKLASELLSQQDHYDFGMREVKSVLATAGLLKKAEPNLPEDVVLLRAFRSSIIPKLVKDDLPLFHALAKDLFPASEVKPAHRTALHKQIETTMVEQYLQIVPEFVEKVIQLHEVVGTRSGVMLVGPTGGGKTTCYETLRNAIAALHCKNPGTYYNISIDVLNPKAITLGELYGDVNKDTQEWRDGLASKLIREAAKDLTEEHHWIVFDGPVDSLWAESMNTALDDTMAFCLANGQRIKLHSRIRVLFEVEDLADASPGTVGRCGVVYVAENTVGWMAYVQSWVQRTFRTEEVLNRELKEMVLNLFDQTVERGLVKIRSGLEEVVRTVDLQLVAGVCNFLEAFLTPKYFAGDASAKKKALQSVFMFSFVWGLASSIDEPSKDKVRLLGS